MMRFISVFKNHGAVFFPVAALCVTFSLFPFWEKFFFAKISLRDVFAWGFVGARIARPQAVCLMRGFPAEAQPRKVDGRTMFAPTLSAMTKFPIFKEVLL